MPVSGCGFWAASSRGTGRAIRFCPVSRGRGECALDIGEPRRDIPDLAPQFFERNPLFGNRLAERAKSPRLRLETFDERRVKIAKPRRVPEQPAADHLHQQMLRSARGV